MNLASISQTTKQVGRILNRNSPTILTALGVGGLISTVILAIKATPKAEEILYHEAEFRIDSWVHDTGGSRDEYPLNPIIEPWEVIELTWKCYTPTALMGLATIGCMIGANSIHLRRNAALASIFSITETALKEYQAKVVEKIGENKEDKIRGELAEASIEKNPYDSKTVIFTNKGSMLCLDDLSGRYFFSDIETLRRVQNDFNKRLLNEMTISLNELYSDMGLESITIGANTGWIVERGMIDFYFGSKITPDGQPCIVVMHKVLPTNIWG